MKRRQFITLLGGAAAAWPLGARSQQQPKMLRVGFVGIQPREAPLYTTFLKRMAELGYQEGRNFAFDYIQTPDIEGYEKNYRELAVRKVDVFDIVSRFTTYSQWGITLPKLPLAFAFIAPARAARRTITRSASYAPIRPNQGEGLKFRSTQERHA